MSPGGLWGGILDWMAIPTLWNRVMWSGWWSQFFSSWWDDFVLDDVDRGRKEYEPPHYMSVNTAVEQLLEVEESRNEKGGFGFCIKFSVAIRFCLGFQVPLFGVLPVACYQLFGFVQLYRFVWCCCEKSGALCWWKLVLALTLSYSDSSLWQILHLVPDYCVEWNYYAAYSEETLAVGMARLGSPDQLIVAGTLKGLLDVDFGAPLHCLVITGSIHVMEEEMLNFFRTK